MKPIRAGVVGAGGIAPEHLQFLAGRPDVQLVGIADRSPITGRYAAQRWSAERSFTDHTALLKLGVDVLHVLTPPDSHASIARDALDAGAHVIVEKPLVSSYAELVSLRAQAQRAERWLLEDHNYRWNDGVQWLQGQVGSGRLGEVRDVEVALCLPIRLGGALADLNLPSPLHRMPGGAVHDFLPHLAYLALLFAPGLDEPDRRAVVWSNHGGDDGLWRTDDLDAVLVRGPVHLRFRFSAHTAPDRFAITVRGAAGDAEIDLFQPFERSRVPRSLGPQLTPLVNQAASGAAMVRQSGRNFRDKITRHTPYHGMNRFLAAVYDAIRDETGPPVTDAEVDASVRLVDLLVEENR